jgi:ABC-2 type transport system ATP-binding protein
VTRELRRPARWIAVAVFAAIVGPSVQPLDPTLHPLPEALTFGCLLGATAFAVLARRPLAAIAPALLPRRRLLARSVVLTTKSAEEEGIWRALVLGPLVHPFGALAALVASTTLFAAAHAPRLGRRALAHLATGSLFGAAYLATGRLTAAVCAHGTYNVLVGLTPVATADMSLSDTGGRTARPVRSVAPTAGQRPMDTKTESTTAESQPLPVARLERVTKSFGRLRALDGVDLELRRGEILALLGPNGAGKSTAVAIMLGLRRPDAGHAELCGRDPRDPEARRTVGAVLQEVGFPPGLRVRDVARLVGAHFAAAPSVPAILSSVDLDTSADRSAAGLSGGQRRRLAVALALAARPDVLFLDEPTAGMDAGGRRALLRELAHRAASGGAVLLTTQQLTEAEEIATRVVLIAHGRTVAHGTVAEIRAHGGLAKVTLRAPTLPSLPGTVSVESRGDRHSVHVEDADAFVAALVRAGVEFKELRVAPVTLEDAFVTLTESVE